MKEKGLALRVTEVALLREQASIEITMSGFRTELARLSVTIGELDIKINEIESADRQRVANELQEARTRLAELATMLPSARRVRDVRLQQSENGVSSTPLRPSHRIVIRRMQKTGVKTLTATEETATRARRYCRGHLALTRTPTRPFTVGRRHASKRSLKGISRLARND